MLTRNICSRVTVALGAPGAKGEVGPPGQKGPGNSHNRYNFNRPVFRRLSWS